MTDSPFDPAKEWDKHCDEQEQFLDRCPICELCGEVVVDEECIDYDGNIYHVECFVDRFKVSTPLSD